MGLTRTYIIDYGSVGVGDGDFVTKNSTTDGAIKKLDEDLRLLFAAFTDEDNLASDSNSKIPSQQSVKSYVDSQSHDVIPMALMLGGT
jgi:hypothetical protein